jgi:hypothetical protein
LLHGIREGKVKEIRYIGVSGLVVLAACFGIWAAVGVPAEGLTLFRVSVDTAIPAIAGSIGGLLAMVWLIVEGDTGRMFS